MKSIIVIAITVISISAYVNPVQGNRDSPDPGVIYHDGAYYAASGVSLQTGFISHRAFNIKVVPEYRNEILARSPPAVPKFHFSTLEKQTFC